MGRSRERFLTNVKERSSRLRFGHRVGKGDSEAKAASERARWASLSVWSSGSVKFGWSWNAPTNF